MTKFRTTNLEYDAIDQFSAFDKGFQNRDPKLEPFVGAWPETASLLQRLEERSFSSEKRHNLVSVLKDQYKSIGQLDRYEDLIDGLNNDSTFTVITAHQPVLFSGPLYVPYKIASAIHLARHLSEAQNERKVVPVFVTGGEDHDFDEMNHLHLYNNRITWDHDSGGPVGRFDLSGIDEAIEEIAQILGEPRSDLKVIELIRSCFSGERNYAQAYQDFIIRLFGQYGLLVINMDSESLKKAFIPIMKREIIEKPSKELVEATQKEKSSAGYDPQAFVREVNLFYIRNKTRSIILPENGGFLLRELEETMTEEDILKELDAHPASFSPNVVLRPLYQEYSLPNIAYIGGGGELSYWTERRSQFEAFGIDYPILVRRSSAIHLESFIISRMKDVGLSLDQLTQDKHKVIKSLVSQDTTLDDELKSISKDVMQEFEKLVLLLEDQADSLGKYARSEERKLEKTLENFQTKSFREIKKEYDVKVGKIEKVFDRLFPNNNLQERYSNFLSYLNRHGKAYLDFLVENLDPLKPTVTIIEEED